MGTAYKIRNGLVVYSQGDNETVFDVQGVNGQLFSVTDNLIGLLHSVNDISGIPIMEVYSDNRIFMGKYGEHALEIRESDIILENIQTASTYDSVLVLDGNVVKKVLGSGSGGGGGLGGVPTSTTLTINNVTFDLSTNRTWNVGTVTSLIAGTGLTGGTITQSGTIEFDVAWGDARYLSTVPVATSAISGRVRLFSDTVQTVAASAITETATRTYGVQFNASGQMVVNVPWVNTEGHPSLSLGVAVNGLQLNTATQVLQLGLASATTTGALSSADWTTFNTKVGGSGTINYIPKWTPNGTTLGNSRLIDNGVSAYFVNQGTNTFFGNGAGNKGVINSNQTAFGDSAAFQNLTGVGWTALGRSAGLNNASGSNWVAVALNSGVNNLTGNSWISIGTNSTRYYSGGTLNAESFSNGVYIGTTAKVGIAGAVNEIVIGHLAEGEGSNKTVIGSSATILTKLFGTLQVGTVNNVNSDFARISSTGIIQKRTLAETKIDLGFTSTDVDAIPNKALNHYQNTSSEEYFDLKQQIENYYTRVQTDGGTIEELLDIQQSLNNSSGIVIKNVDISASGIVERINLRFLEVNDIPQLPFSKIDNYDIWATREW